MSDATSATVSPNRTLGALAVVIMLLAVAGTYRSPALFSGQWRIQGLDDRLLHERRIEFALSQFREHGTIPAWYPRELLGSPFWANVQNFPLMPQRLLLLPAGAENVFTLAVNVSAGLAAVFTFLYARSIGIGLTGSAVAGWTFAAAGFFASRVGAGHLGVLEAYPALPALLWTVEKFAAADPRATARWLLAIGGLTAVFALVSHPQVSIYSIAAAGVYALWRCGGPRRWIAPCAIALGVGVAMIQLWPMLLLIARSTRVLALEPAANDLPLPAARLAAMIFPWMHGAPAQVDRPGGVGDFSLGDVAVFWDTVNYVGWLPVFAGPALAIIALARRRRPGAPAVFLSVAAVAAVLLAMQIPQKLLPESPYLILRSSSRLMYVVTFALAIAAGAAVGWILATRRAVAAIIATLLVVAHAADVYSHNSRFIRAARAKTFLPESAEQAIRSEVGTGRVAIDLDLYIKLNRQLDDVGFFDSIMLADVYQTLLDLAGARPTFNVQQADGSRLPGRVLSAAGVRLVLTSRPIGDIPPAERIGQVLIYQPGRPAPRVAFFPAGSEMYLSRQQIRDAIRGNKVDVTQTLLLSAASPVYPGTTPPPDTAPIPLPFRRPNPDRIEITLDQPVDGFVRVLESHDIGWRATVDGVAAPVLQAHNMVLAVPVRAGRREVVLEYFTPGKWTGAAISVTSAAALGSLAFFTRARRPRQDRISEGAARLD